MSRIESGKIELEHSVFYLSDLLDQIDGMFSQRAQEKGVDFCIDSGALTVDAVKGDALRMGQILINIVSNAVKFTPAGGCVRLKVRQKWFSEESVSLEFLITDTGIGISEAFQARIFEPFGTGKGGDERASTAGHRAGACHLP